MVKKDKLVKFIKLPKVKDDGFLIFAQHPDTIPFAIKRIYYILEANPKLPRGFHAHFNTQQVLFCIQGKIDLVLDDGNEKKLVTLKDPEKGVVLDKLIWHEMHNFQQNTLLLVLASKEYDPEDYIRDYDQFKKITSKDNSDR